MLSPSEYLKHFCLNRVPFRPQPDPEVFFAEAGRGKILQGLCADIVAGRPIVKLIGGEGAGKTLFALLLNRKLGIKKLEVVILDHPAGSFEDLLGTICRSLNTNQAAEQESVEPGRNGAGHLPWLLHLLREKSRAGQRVVLLIDEAEQLFMATLERLVRLIAEIGPEQKMQLVLIGRPELDRNLQQLSSYCRQVDTHAGYFLAPLDDAETGGYLCFRLIEAGGDPDKAGELFSEEAISALRLAANGNLRLINHFAEQGLLRACEAGASQVGAGFVLPGKEKRDPSPVGFAQLKDWLRQYRVRALAGSLLVLALLLVFLRPEGEAPVHPGPPEKKAVAVEKKKSPAVIGEAKVQVSEAAGKNDPVKPALPREGQAVAPPQHSAPPASQSASAGGLPAVTGQARSGQAVPFAENPAGKEEAAPSAAPEAHPVPLSSPAVAEQRQAPPPRTGGEVPALFETPEAKAIILQPDGKKRRSVDTPDVAKHPAVTPAKDPDQLYAERMKASARWRSSQGFTIQLMALASETAEENFKTLLSQERYAAVQSQLYVVRKEVPPTLFVYYGFFDTMEKARRERDSLPAFLRKNQPYPLSIDQALKKAQK